MMASDDTRQRSSIEEAGKTFDRFTLGAQQVDPCAFVGETERHAAHQLLFVRQAEMRGDDPMKRRECGLR